MGFYSKIEHAVFLYGVLFLGVVSAQAATPPAVPQSRSYSIFSPFEFTSLSTDHYGADVVSAGGPACLDYDPILDYRLSVPPTASRPSPANLNGYLQILQLQAGILYAVSHGGEDDLIYTVEAYENSPAGIAATTAAVQGYISAGIGRTNEILAVTTSDGYPAVAVTNAWVQRMLVYAKVAGSSPYHDVVVQQGCNVIGQALAFVNATELTRNYASQDALVYLSTSLINPSYYTQISSAIFDNMSGVRNDALGFYGNASFQSTLGPANGLSPGIFVTFHTDYVSSQASPPVASDMRLYNAPRIVKSEVRQDTDLDGSFATQLYYYDPYASYPYGSGTSDYPGSPALAGQISSSSAPIKVSLQFSEPMDTRWSDFLVQLQFSDNSTQNLSGSWSTTENADDTWTSTTSFTDGFTQGLIRVAVRARKIICGSGLDTGVQELDTTGSGLSGASPSYDTSTSFAIQTSSPACTTLLDATGSPLTSPVQQSSAVLLNSVGDAAGVASISLSGPSGPLFTGYFTASTNAEIGPFPQLATGVYTSTVTDSAGNLCVSTFGVVTSAMGTTPIINSLGVTGSVSTVAIGIDTTTLSTSNTVFSIGSLATVASTGAAQALCETMVVSCATSNCSSNPATSTNTLSYCAGGCGWIHVPHPTPVNSYCLFSGANNATFTISAAGVVADVNVTATISNLSSGADGEITYLNPTGASILTDNLAVQQYGQTTPIASTDSVTSLASPLASVSASSQSATTGMTNSSLSQVLAQLAPLYSIYSIQGSDFVFPSSGTITLSTTAPPGTLVDTTTLALYQFNGTAWSTAAVSNQSVSVSSLGVVTSSGMFSRSGTYGMFYAGHDSSAPVTTA